EMFMGPLEIAKPWSTNGLSGVHRFLDRVYRLSQRPISDDAPPDNLVRLLHKTIKKVTEDTDSLAFNTAIAQMMIFVNELFKAEKLYRALWEPFVLIISPYAPHLGEELWEQLGHEPSVSKVTWPTYDEALTRDEIVTVVLQVNGKVRGKIEVPADTPTDELERLALENDRIQQWTADKEIVKRVTVPGKLVNLVVR
ncbi:MAG: class I tRNA ligase family protein, partial [Spirochaetaceae bacterium]|nr:class I tRNA ligase family protein [Spirochaetaceae bacterium]